MPGEVRWGFETGKVYAVVGHPESPYLVCGFTEEGGVSMVVARRPWWPEGSTRRVPVIVLDRAHVLPMREDWEQLCASMTPPKLPTVPLLSMPEITEAPWTKKP